MGMFLLFISIVVVNYGWIFFLVYDVKLNILILYKVWLYSFVDKLIFFKKGIKVKEVYYVYGIVFLVCESGLLKVVEVWFNFIIIFLKGFWRDC